MRTVTLPHSHLPRLAISWAPANLATAAAVVALLDLCACGLYWSFFGVPLERVARGPAAWVVGSDAARAMGGWGVLLGMLVLYAIAAAEVAAYRALARRFQALLRQPVRWGMAYGALAFAILDQVLVPLSAAPRQAQGTWFVALLLIHVFVIGVACALLARGLVRRS